MAGARGFGTVRSWVVNGPKGPVLHVTDSDKGREATLDLDEDIRKVWYLGKYIVYERKPDA